MDEHFLPATRVPRVHEILRRRPQRGGASEHNASEHSPRIDLAGAELELILRSEFRAADQPWLMAVMVGSADGAASIDGLSGSLGGEGDRRMFHAIRSLADVILVGAGTARSEGYRSPREGPGSSLRTGAGQRTSPRLALVSRSLDLDGIPALEAGAVEDPARLPYVICPADADPGRAADLNGRAEVLPCGSGGEVDLEQAIVELGHRGEHIISCEGGPTLLGQLVDSDLIDEWLLTMSPTIVAGSAGRIVAGGRSAVRRLVLDRVMVQGDELFCRYLRADHSKSDAGITSS